MTQDELKSAYDRFEALPTEDKTRLDDLATALCQLILTDKGREDTGVILPNRVSALVALEAARAFETASWQTP
jgi:hypothetical protein